MSFQFTGCVGVHTVPQEARAAQQDWPMDAGHAAGRRTPPDPAGAVGQTAEAGAGPFGGREGEPTVATVGQRAAPPVLRAGAPRAFLRTVPAAVQ